MAIRRSGWTLVAGLAWVCSALYGAVGDFTRTVVSTRLNGWDGVQFIKWEKTTSSSNCGRAWAVKVDLSKGYRLRTQLGDANGNRATVGTMAETIAAAEGVVPIMGVNADYFDVNVSYARPTGLVITDDLLATAGWPNAAAPEMCYICETADGNLVHTALTRDPSLPTGYPSASWQVTAAGKKIRQAVRTNYCNYPVKAGVMNPVNNPISSGGSTFPTTIGNMQSRTQYPRPLVGIGTNELGVATNLVLFVNDGRQSGWSINFPDVDAYQIMIDEGCSEVGEFDGGGSAAMWMASGADSIYNFGTTHATAHGNYVNRPSDGSPRKDACGLFLLPPANRTYTVEINDGNLYETLDDAFAVIAPGDVVKVLAPTTLSTNAAPRVCMLVCDDPAATVTLTGPAPVEGAVFCAGPAAARVPRVILPAGSDLVLQAASSAAGGTLRWVRPTDTSGRLTVANYVQDGLVTHFDAIDNAGTGVHDASLAVWKDLKGSASLTRTGAAAWGDRWLDTSTTQQTLTAMPEFYYDAVTTEIAANVISNGPSGSYPRLFKHPSRDGEYTAYYSGTGSTLELYLNNSGTRPRVGTFRAGTMAVVGDATGLRPYNNAVLGTGTVTGGGHHRCIPTNWTLNGAPGYLHGLYRAIRHYTRPLSVDELAHNTVLDGLRFFSYSVTGTGTAEAKSWTSAGWDVPYGKSATAPAATTNEYVQIVNAKVTAANAVALKGLSLEAGAVLELAANTTNLVKVLYVGGEEVRRGIYTGSGGFGTQVGWLEGEGVLSVAGGLDRSFPVKVPVPAADGWYEFGLRKADGGYVSGNTEAGYAGGGSYHCLKADRPIWDEYAFPAGAKLRLKGYVLLEQIPAGVFDAYDFSGLEYVMFHSGKPFADGSKFAIPSGCLARYQPGTWTESGGKWYLTKEYGSAVFSAPLEVNGQLRVHGDGTHDATQQFDGDVTGTGSFYETNYSNQMRVRGAFVFDGTLSGGQNANLLWIDSLVVTGRLGEVSLPGCSGKYGTNYSYNVAGIFFGRDSSEVPARGGLYMTSLAGNAVDITDIPSGKRFRQGGAICVWGSNTVHVGTLKGATHVVGRRQDLKNTNGWFNKANSRGFGNLLVDVSTTSGALFLSTNVNVTVGSVTGNTIFDYTFCENVANPFALTITNSCVTGAAVRSVDLCSLPARIRGFRGSVSLTGGARSYVLPIDLTHGTNTLYQTAGCDGTGTLAAAPATSTIDVTFPTTKNDLPVIGDYAVARFTSGGERLAGWTVTLNGEATTKTSVGGMSVDVRKDATGIWLAVRKGGFSLTFR